MILTLLLQKGLLGQKSLLRCHQHGRDAYVLLASYAFSIRNLADCCVPTCDVTGIDFLAVVNQHEYGGAPQGTVPLISPVQHVYPCSETRHCKHRHHRAWRCGTRSQVYQHAFLSSSSPLRKVDAAHSKCWTSAQEHYNTTGVKAGLQVQGLPER